ncbi:hypothetical protein [Elizabethkingia ursingii]|uniref:Uncharacterized protein n=1 Tax=Elizabethkingia ursingii TaxID=1756150 RepID=A0AAJ3NAL9_9FLAO|nr:hypothetical protein [Elizabethkingia ursingii]AQX08034.1 hypothetical protein BBD34_04965 [Elizabethkingia ursingii]OPB73612.1 hypothetical protein BAY32_11255 [Elizabethkingia ursingii]
MRKVLFFFTLNVSILSFAQGRNISLSKKIKEPRVLSTGDTLKINQVVFYKLGNNPDGSFRFVQDLNGMNEPIRPSGSRASMMKQPILFFKEKDGVVYAFTKYFVTNIEAAIQTKEIEIIK